MNEFFTQLIKVPWSNEKVGTIIRILASFLFVSGSLYIGAFVYTSFIEGPMPGTLLGAVIWVAVYVYMLILFARVALKGNTPRSWLPWS